MRIASTRIRMSSMRHLLLGAIPLLASCYSYTPLKIGDVREGEDIRVRVNATYAKQLEPLLGLQDARVVAGALIKNLPDTLIVEVPTVVRADIGNATQTLRQRVSIPRNELVDLEMRTLDRARTGTLVAVATVGITVLIVKSLRKDPGHEDTPGGGGPEFRRP
jgi:hypothetical protein